MEQERWGYFFWNYLVLGLFVCLIATYFLKERLLQDTNGFLILFLLCLNVESFLFLIDSLRSVHIKTRRLVFLGLVFFFTLTVFSWSLVLTIILGGSFLIAIFLLFLFLS